MRAGHPGRERPGPERRPDDEFEVRPCPTNPRIARRPRRQLLHETTSGPSDVRAQSSCGGSPRGARVGVAVEGVPAPDDESYGPRLRVPSGLCSPCARLRHPRPSPRRTITSSPQRWRARARTRARHVVVPLRRATRSVGYRLVEFSTMVGPGPQQCGTAAARGAGAPVRDPQRARPSRGRRPFSVACRSGGRPALAPFRPTARAHRARSPAETHSQPHPSLALFAGFDRVVVHSWAGAARRWPRPAWPRQSSADLPPRVPQRSATADDGRTVLALGVIRHYKGLPDAVDAVLSIRRAPARGGRHRVPLQAAPQAGRCTGRVAPRVPTAPRSSARRRR